MAKITELVLKMTIFGGKKVAKDLYFSTQNPKENQIELLKSIIGESVGTKFGRKYGFDEIESLEDYERRIPLTDYDFYQEQIERMAEGDTNVLCADKAVHFNLTSGTMGNPKKIPLTEKQISLFSKYNAKYLNYVAAQSVGEDWTKGKGLSLSEGTYKVLPSGATIGSASSLHTARMAKAMPFLKINSMDMLYTSPKEARQPSSYSVYSRYLHALFALREKNICYGNVTFSSLLLELMRYIELNWRILCDDIENGTVDGVSDIPEDERISVLEKLTPMPDRADELRNIFENHINEPFGKLIWPNLRFFICVAGDGFQTYTNKVLDRYLGKKTHILYLGLTSSEGLYSVPFDMDNPNSVLVPNGVYMEFIPVEEGERDLSQGIKHLWELDKDKQYELVITNLSGLYRYQLKDVIKVTGFYNNTPVIQFMNRAGFAVNICAEKTSYKALQYAAEQTCNELGLDMYDYVVCPVSNESGYRYIFIYEINSYPENLNRNDLRNVTEKYLIEANPVYLEGLQSGDLQPMEVKLLQNESFLLYRDLMIMKGCSSAQLKPIHVTETPFQERFFLKLENKEINF